jgi:hypothetical protein
MDCEYLDTNMYSEQTYQLVQGFTLMKDVYSEVHLPGRPTSITWP